MTYAGSLVESDIQVRFQRWRDALKEYPGLPVLDTGVTQDSLAVLALERIAVSEGRMLYRVADAPIPELTSWQETSLAGPAPVGHIDRAIIWFDPELAVGPLSSSWRHAVSQAALVVASPEWSEVLRDMGVISLPALARPGRRPGP